MRNGKFRFGIYLGLAALLGLFLYVVSQWMITTGRVIGARQNRRDDVCVQLCHPNAVIVCKEVSGHIAHHDGLHAVCSQENGSTVARKATLEQLNAYKVKDYR